MELSPNYGFWVTIPMIHIRNWWHFIGNVKLHLTLLNLLSSISADMIKTFSDCIRRLHWQAFWVSLVPALFQTCSLMLSGLWKCSQSRIRLDWNITQLYLPALSSSLVPRNSVLINDTFSVIRVNSAERLIELSSNSRQVVMVFQIIWQFTSGHSFC